MWRGHLVRGLPAVAWQLDSVGLRLTLVLQRVDSPTERARITASSIHLRNHFGASGCGTLKHVVAHIAFGNAAVIYDDFQWN